MWTDFWKFCPPPPLWSLLQNKAYVVIWTFGKKPSPCHVHMAYELPLKEFNFISLNVNDGHIAGIAFERKIFAFQKFHKGHP